MYNIMIHDFFAFFGKSIDAIVTFLAKALHWDDSMPSTDNTLTELPIVHVEAPVEPKTAPESTTTTEELPKSYRIGLKPKILNWATAVSHWEAALASSNNPGNLKYTTLTSTWGATKGRAAADGGYFCQFPSYASGFVALCNFLTLGAEGQLIISHPLPCTLQAFTERFAGNPPQGYIDGIAKMLNVPTSVDIATFLV